MQLPILVYHQVEDPPIDCWYPGNYVRPRQFEAQLALLRRARYTSITFAQYLAFRRGEAACPRRPIILTFDDGYRSIGERACPLLSDYGFTATVFLVTGQIGATNAWDAEARQEPLLTSADILELHRCGIEFQSHTRTHPRLTSLAPDAVRDELRGSRADLQALLGSPIDVICYPYGAHGAQVEEIARDVGYRAGVITRRRLNRDDTNPLALRRIPVSYRTSLSRFAWDLFRLKFHGA